MNIADTHVKRHSAMHTHVELHTQTKKEKAEKRNLNNMVDDNSVSSNLFLPTAEELLYW